MAHQIETNTSTLQSVLDTINLLPEAIDITTPLAELNAANGGTAATTIDAAVDNTEAHASSQEALIAQIASALEGKAAGGGSGGGSIETCTVTLNFVRGNATYLTTLVDGKANITYWFDAGETIVTNFIKGGLAITPNEMYISSGPYETFFDFGSEHRSFIINGDCTIIYNPCFVRDTDILLADGTTKHVQDITYDDELLVWNFDNGCYASAKPLWIKKAQTSDYYYLCKFDNGTELKLVGSDGRCHRVFSLDRNMFESATECVGERIVTNDGIATLLSCERVDKTVDFYNIITEKHINLFAEGILTSCRLNNIYPIVDMRFVKDDRQIVPYESFEGISLEFYNGLRLGEQPMDLEELTKYVRRLNELKEVS